MRLLCGGVLWWLGGFSPLMYCSWGSAPRNSQVNHEDFVEGIIQVQAKKKASLNYYA